LKLSLLKHLAPTGKKTLKLKGILKDVDVTEEDILSVQKSLYSKDEALQNLSSLKTLW